MRNSVYHCIIHVSTSSDLISTEHLLARSFVHQTWVHLSSERVEINANSKLMQIIDGFSQWPLIRHIQRQFHLQKDGIAEDSRPIQHC